MAKLRVWTPFWQIMGRGGIQFEEWMRLEREYADTWTLVDDLEILLKTIPAVLWKDGAH